MGSFVKIAEMSDVGPGTGKVVVVDGNEIALFNIQGQYYAIHNTCPHRGGPLGEGYIDGNVVTCPWHGWEFDVTTGESPINSMIRVRSLPVRVEGNEVKVEL